jgi:hypothetical protein
VRATSAWMVASDFSGTKMVVTFQSRFAAFILGLGAVLAAAQPNPAGADDLSAIPAPALNACTVGHRFEPGPIAGGHNRQPTVREFQARMAQLSQFGQSDACTYSKSNSPNQPQGID